MSPLLERILAHALPIGVRIAGMMTFAPFFNSEAFPARVKAAFVLVAHGDALRGLPGAGHNPDGVQRLYASF